MTTKSRSRLFCVREKGAAVTNIELFFDLVLVFAITQLSHRILLNLTPAAAVEPLVLFLAVGVAGQVMHQAPLIVGTGETGALVTAAVWQKALAQGQLAALDAVACTEPGSQPRHCPGRRCRIKARPCRTR